MPDPSAAGGLVLGRAVAHVAEAGRPGGFNPWFASRLEMAPQPTDFLQFAAGDAGERHSLLAGAPGSPIPRDQVRLEMAPQPAEKPPFAAVPV